MIKKYYDEDWLRDVCSRVNLLDYASQMFNFRRSGSDNYATICPLHGDTDPSLTITPSRNMWYCFGCKRGGNIINWLMVYEGLSFRRAIEKIADMVGEDIPDFRPSSSLAVFKNMEKAVARDDKKVERKILPQSYLDRFQIPSAGEPHEWIEEGISLEAIERFGIRIDTAGNRIIYPVYDNNDNLIGVKGRTRFRNYKTLGIAKYINYERIGTVDYLQGMKENRENILRSGEVIVFEGLKSVMKAWDFGYDNAVASETSRLCDEQIRALLALRLKKITLAFDNDVPRQQVMDAANKLKPFMNVYVIQDRERLLGDPSEKRAPVDCGREVWEKLYAEKGRVV